MAPPNVASQLPLLCVRVPWSKRAIAPVCTLPAAPSPDSVPRIQAQTHAHTPLTVPPPTLCHRSVTLLPRQANVAFQCAVVLRDLISPYLLRRLKKDVNAQLPAKTEEVLFCKLTPEQRAMYTRFLQSREVQDVLDQKAASFR
jgi:hypothetical protein